MLAERQLECYNARKIKPFLECFAEAVKVEVFASKKIVYANFADFQKRYDSHHVFVPLSCVLILFSVHARIDGDHVSSQSAFLSPAIGRYACVFTNSNGGHPQAKGEKLKCDVTKRIFLEPVRLSDFWCFVLVADREDLFVVVACGCHRGLILLHWDMCDWQSESGQPSFCIDFERILHLVRPVPPAFDGRYHARVCMTLCMYVCMLYAGLYVGVYVYVYVCVYVCVCVCVCVRVCIGGVRRS